MCWPLIQPAAPTRRSRHSRAPEEDESSQWFERGNPEFRAPRVNDCLRIHKGGPTSTGNVLPPSSSFKMDKGLVHSWKILIGEEILSDERFH